MHHKQLRTACFTCICALVLAACFARSGLASHGESLDGNLKYPPDFKHFDYVCPEARKGGELVLHDLGSFDKLNPFTLKGAAPAGLLSYVFETLVVPSLDEPFANYGLIAKDITLAEDKLSVTFTLNEAATFSNGTQITADDVLFSLETLKSDKAHPFYQMYLKDIKNADVLSPTQIRFNFAKVNRELHMIAGQLPVLSKAFYEKHPFLPENGADGMVIPVGSGPYVIEEVHPGKSIRYKRNPKYWASNHPTRVGMFNFDSITIKYFKDQIVSVEAFKAGEFDVMLVNIAKQWQRDLVGRRFDDGVLVKAAFPHHNNAGMQGFIFNTRKPLFTNRKVRQALGLAFDFEWANRSLFYGQYTRSHSYFSNSELAATGLPEAAELRLLEPYRDQLPQEVFTLPLTPPKTTKPDSLRGNLRKAKKLLAEAGWQVKDGVLVNADNKPFRFEIVLVSPSFERVMAPYVNNLKKLGIEASYRTIDPALYTDRMKNFDFDMTVTVIGQSQSPGNEQRDFWTSAAAEHKGSRNYAGIQDPVVDVLVEKIIYAEDREQLVAACRALDRVLWYGYYVVPNWYLANHRLAFVKGLRHPKTLPLYYNYEQFLNTWWFE
ncbi:MAG: ABC transporter substrate-binding protein [Desulfobulbus propionicus]|nr:MAG: ABC transporter substrate-binding protein [Desulfobulbus propionicus]